MKLLFLGVGNLHRADDGVGPYMAEMLRDHPDLLRLGVEVLPHSGEGVSLMHVWQEADFVVIVDAMKSKSKLGTIRRFDVAQDKLSGGVFRYSSHLFGLAEAVEMARAMNQLPARMIVYGIEGKEFAFGEPFSPAVAKAAEKVEKAVLAEFREFADA